MSKRKAAKNPPKSPEISDSKRRDSKGKAAFRKNPTPSGRSGDARRRDLRKSDNLKTSVWLYGRHAVPAALENQARRPKRVLMADGIDEALRLEVTSKLNSLGKNIPLEVVERPRLDEIVGEDAIHQGLALEVEPLAQRHIDELIAEDRAFGMSQSPRRRVLLALDQITDPQNVGAILRSAAAFGAEGLIIPDRHAAPESGALARAASGALELVPRFEVGNLSRGLARLQEAGWWVAGLAEEADESLASWQAPEKVVLVLGAEGPGLRRLTRETCDLLLRLPTNPDFASLNVSNAAAVALFALLAN